MIYLIYVKLLAKNRKPSANQIIQDTSIHTHKMPENTFFISNTLLTDGSLNLLQKWFFGKPIGATWKFGNSVFEIIDIRR